MHRTGLCFVLILGLLLAVSVKAAGSPFFQGKVRIPFALQSGSKVIKPGVYKVAVRLEGNKRILTLQSARGDTVLRTYGQRVDSIPEEDRQFKQRFQMKIRRMPDQSSPGKNWIVFDLDYRPGNRDVFRRLTFRIREAARAAK